MNDDEFARLMLEYQRCAIAGVWAAVRRSPGLLARHDVEDLIQEANLQIWKQRAKYDPERGSFCAWAWRVAFNYVTGFARQLGHLPIPSELEENETSNKDFEAWDSLRHCLEQLPKWDRALVTAYHLINPQLLNDWARMLGMTRTALDVRVCRIRQALLDCLAKEDNS
jgi:RNA polymerase sigma factor (sigma-70 family)